MSELADTIKLRNLITQDNEKQFVWALRMYYFETFRNGDSDESFVLWMETHFMDDDGNYKNLLGEAKQAAKAVQA